MQRQRDRDYAKELCASRLAFTLSRTGTSTLIETARYFEDTSVSWFLGL